MKLKFMKKVLVALLLVWFVPSAFAWQNDMSSLTDWGQGSNATDEYDPLAPPDLTGGIYVVDLELPAGYDAVQCNSWSDTGGGQAGYTDLWYNTGVVIADETVYTMTARMISYITEGGGKSVKMAMKDVDAGWSTIVWGSPFVSNTGFADYSISFTTVGPANTAAIGHVIGIGIDNDWWNNLAVDNVVVIPEPATMALLGLGGLLLRRRKI